MRLTQRTDSLRLLRAFAAGALHYNPSIKQEVLAHDQQRPRTRPSAKKRSQFRVASRNIAALYETVETVVV